MASVKPMCPKTGDDAHRVYRNRWDDGPRGGYFFGYTEAGDKVYLCADCGLMFTADGKRVHPGVSIVGDEPEGYRGDARQVFGRRGAA